MKKIIIALAILLSAGQTYSQQLPSDKAGKSYFKALQSGQVASTDLIEWHQFGPGTSGYCEMLWQHPTDEKVMIMSPDMHNTYGSWDGGETWLTVKDVDEDNVSFNRVMAVDFASTKPDLGYAVDGGGRLFRTKDRGRSWQQMEFIPGHQSALAADPTDERVWFMGPGRFWDVKQNHRQQKNLADPGIGARKKNEGYIYRSTDAGASWEKITGGLPKSIEVGQIIVNPADPKMVFLTSNHGVYKSEDRGETWRASYAGIPNRIVRDLDSHFDKRSKKLTLFALDQTSYYPDGKSVRSEGGVYRSDDLGESWYSITGNLAIDMTQINEKNIDWYYSRTVAAWMGISLAELRKRHTERPKSILSVFNHLKVNPLNIDEIYISGNYKHDFGFAPGDIWKTNDGGKSWIATARSGAYWLSGRDDEYWKSRNNPIGVNESFAHLQPNVDRVSQVGGSRLMEMGLNGELYTNFEQQLFRTTDGGETWQQRDDIETSEGSGYWIGRGGSNLPGRFILLETGIKDRILLCSGEHGLWQTESREGANGGKKVAVKQIEGQLNTHGAHSIADVAVDPKDPNIIYTIQFRQTHRGFFRRSVDGGKTWENISEPLPWSEGTPSSVHIFQNSLLVDPNNGKNIYFSVIENYLSDVHGSDLDWDKYPDFGVHRSQDGGFTWQKVNSGLPAGCSVRRLAMDPKKSDRLYAALNISRKKVRGGLYRTDNGGDEWSQVKIPAEIESVNNIFVDRNNGSLYISCGAPEGSLESGGVWRSEDSGKSWKKIFFIDYIWQCESSPVDPDILLVNAAGKRKGGHNPGAYLSLDGGKSWSKVNQNLGQPNTITDLKPDTYDRNKFWGALKGSGWLVGYLNEK